MRSSTHLRRVPYDPDADLLPVAMVSSSYGLMAARKDLPANNLQEFIALAKQQPGRFTFGSAGAATSTHITGEIVHLRAGIKLLAVTGNVRHPEFPRVATLKAGIKAE